MNFQNLALAMAFIDALDKGIGAPIWLHAQSQLVHEELDNQLGKVDKKATRSVDEAWPNGRQFVLQQIGLE
jgi:hypothetical protein